MRILDPTSELRTTARPRAPRLQSLEGATIGLLDISKPMGDIYLDVIESDLKRRGARVERFRKPMPSGLGTEEEKKELLQDAAGLVLLGSIPLGTDTVECWTRPGTPWPAEELQDWP